MESRYKFFKVFSIVSFLLLCILFIFGVVGISLKGRVIERMLVLAFAFSYLLLVFTTLKFNKKKKLLLFPFIPVIFLFLNPIILFHFGIMILSNTFSNEEVYFQKNEYRIIKGNSPMTNNYYVIIKEEGILDYMFGTFQTAEINLHNFEIDIDQDSVYLRNGNAKYSEVINKYN